jgi:hypothetical protein
MAEANNIQNGAGQGSKVEQQMKTAISQCEQHISSAMASREPTIKIALAPMKHSKVAEEEPKPDREAFEAIGLFKAVKKRTRSVLSPHQHSILQREFAKEPFPSKVKREAMGKHIGCSQRTIQIWFQNQRQKNRQNGQVMKAVGPLATPNHPSRSVPLYTMPMVMSAKGMVFPKHFASNPPSPSLSYKGNDTFEGLNALVDVAMAELVNITPADKRLARPTLHDLIKVAPPSLKSISLYDEKSENGPGPLLAQAKDTKRDRVCA